MKSFLTYVAQDIIQKYGNNLSDIAIVFPNKRASLFLNEQLARLVSHPLWSPTYITISDLFRQHTTLKVGDPSSWYAIFISLSSSVLASKKHSTTFTAGDSC